MEGSCFSNQDLKGKDPHPWLSVVVPIYNAEKHLNACIRSALKYVTDSQKMISGFAIIAKRMAEAFKRDCLEQRRREVNI